MLIATLVHWDKFNHGDAPLVGAAVFYGWVAVYIVSPFVVFALWWFNRRTDSREPAPGEAIVPVWVRRMAQAGAAGAFVAAGVFFLAPEVAIDIWPWELTPLTSRVLGAFTARLLSAPGGQCPLLVRGRELVQAPQGLTVDDDLGEAGEPRDGGQLVLEVRVLAQVDLFERHAALGQE